MPWPRSSRIVAATAASSVVTTPPSPVVTFFVAYSEKQPVPNEPTGRPSMLAPTAWAASSTTAAPDAAASEAIAPISAGYP